MCGGGGCGKVLGLAASFVVPMFAPAMLGSIGITSALGQTIGSSIIGGMISSATGGNFLSGAAGSLLGSGINAGFSGGEFSASNMGGAFNSAVDSGVPAFSFQTGGGGGNTSAVTGMTGGETAPGLNTMGAAGNVMDPNMASGPLLGATPGSSLINPNGQIGMFNQTGAATPGVGFTASPNNVALDVNAGGGALPNVGGAEGGTSFLGNLGNNALKALPQLAGAFANQGPSTGDLQGYLDNQAGLDRQAYDFNVASANKKAAIGDNLAADARSMDPSYFGRQQQFTAQAQADGQWQDSEQRLRAQGYDENYINAMKQKNNLSTSQKTGTAFDQGSQTGLNMRNNTFQTAGSMYGTVAGPTNNYGNYAALAESGKKDANDAGAAIENLFKINQKDNKTGTTNSTVA